MSYKIGASEKPPSHLFPEELSNPVSTAAVTTQAKQADEHDEKQRDVSNNHGDECECAALAVRYHTGRLGRHPCRADLWAE